MGRAGRIAAGLAGAGVLALALAQLLLPGIAASRISGRVGRYGHVRSVHVSAWPAVELLWGDADSITVRASSLSLAPARAAKLLWEARGASKMDVSADSASVGALRVSGVRVHKRGDQLSAQAFAAEGAVRAALPSGLEVELLHSGGGSVEARARGGLFGIAASIDAVAGPREGKLVVQPRALFLAGVSITLFADPHVYIEGVGAEAAVERGVAQGYRLSARARLH